jgi:ubiquinone/menaquinone biosynthesis C-methylase UbiE
MRHDGDLTRQVTSTYTALAGRWDTGGAAWNQPVADRLVALAGPAPGMRVLDAGCGAGAASVTAARAVGPGGHVVGIDTAEPMLTRARQHAGEAGLGNTAFQHADAADPPFGPASFDAVLASMVIYLLPDPAAAIARWRELLRPGGALAFTWVIAEDPAWDPVFAAVDAFLPTGQEGWCAFTRRSPWNSAAAVEGMLPRAAYSVITTVVEPVVTRYRDRSHWWESSWTQAPRLFWQHIPQAQREAARAAAFGHLEGLGAPDGSLARARTVGYTIARRP